MNVTKKDLARFAEEVRDQARHAAACAFKGEDYLGNIENIDIEALVDHFWDEDSDDITVLRGAVEYAQHEFDKSGDRQASGVMKRALDSTGG